MKTYLKPLMMLLMSSSVFFTACEEEAESPAPEDETFPNAFSFKLDDYYVDFSQVSNHTFRVGANPEIRFKKDKGLGPGKLKVDLREFIEETMREVYTQLGGGIPVTVSISIDDPDDMVAEISGNQQFKISNFEFTLFLADETNSYAYDCEFSGAEGKYNTAKVAMEFEMITPLTGSEFPPILYEGTAEGKRNQ